MVRLLRKKNRRKDNNTVEETINCDSDAETTIASIARLDAFKDSIEVAIENAEITKLTATDDHGAVPHNEAVNWISEDEAAAFARSVFYLGCAPVHDLFAAVHYLCVLAYCFRCGFACPTYCFSSGSSWAVPGRRVQTRL